MILTSLGLKPQDRITVSEAVRTTYGQKITRNITKAARAGASEEDLYDLLEQQIHETSDHITAQLRSSLLQGGIIHD